MGAGRLDSEFSPTLGQHGCENKEELIRDRLVQNIAGVHTCQGLTGRALVKVLGHSMVKHPLVIL